MPTNFATPSADRWVLLSMILCKDGSIKLARRSNQFRLRLPSSHMSTQSNTPHIVHDGVYCIKSAITPSNYITFLDNAEHEVGNVASNASDEQQVRFAPASPRNTRLISSAW